MSTRHAGPSRAPYFNDPHAINGSENAGNDEDAVAYPDPMTASEHLAEQQPTESLQGLVQAAASAAAEGGDAIGPHGTSLPMAGAFPSAKRKLSLDLTEGNEGEHRVALRNPAHRRESSRPKSSHDPDQARSPAPAPPPALIRPEGIHSAAAIFRAPSTTVKKHTRPPMALMFQSFQKSPEEYLQLTADAKAFMLDPDHPERQECVGIRGKTDGHSVKLSLTKCVAQFLEERAGSTYFGPTTADVESIDEGSRLIWPQDSERIIELCMPLLRRVVSNEKQRQYARKTRQVGSRKDQVVSDELVNHHDGDNRDMLTGLPDRTRPELLFFRVDGNGSSNLLGFRSIDLRSTAHGWPAILDLLTEMQWDSARIQVQTSDGLQYVSDESSFQHALTQVMEAPWLEAKVRIIVTESGN